MSVISISTFNTDPGIRENLLQELSFLDREGIKVSLSENSCGKFLFLNCSVSEEAADEEAISHENVLRYYLAYLVTDLLLNAVTKNMMEQVIKSRYRRFEADDLRGIIHTAYSYLNNLHSDGEIEKTLLRHNQILELVNDYFQNNSQLFLEGFLRFRLKDYYHELEESVERAVDSFLMEQEYHEFIHMLRYFVEIQEPRVDEVHVLVKDKTNFYLLDEQNQPIDQLQLQGVLTDVKQEVDYEDLLLSALITLAPSRIVLHILERVEIIETIQRIFCERVRLCVGCDLCEANRLPAPKRELELIHTP